MAARELPDTTSSTRSDGLFLAILAVGILLRLPGIWQFDIWQDEIYSIYEARDLIHSPFGPGGMELRPLYFLAMHPLVMALPRAVVIFRIPSLLFGIAGIVATWSLVRRTLGRGAAVVATGVLAVLPLHINTSQIIRYWSLVYLIGALFAAALIKALSTNARRDHLMVLLWLLVGTLTHPTFAITAVGVTLAAHLVRDNGEFGMRWPSRLAWRLSWIPAVVLLLLYYASLWMFFTTERLVGEAVGAPGLLLPALAFNLSPALVIASGLGTLLLLSTRSAIERRFGLMTLLGTGISAATLMVGGALHALPVSVLYLSAAFPLVLGAAGALAPCLAGTAAAVPRLATALLLVLAAALAPGTVSQLLDGSRFDYRPALARVQKDDPKGTLVMWPKVQATWSTPDLETLEFRPTTPIPLFDSLMAARPRFWTITSRRRTGTVGDSDGSKRRWLNKHCGMVLSTGRPRFDYDEYVAELWECHQ